MSADAIQAVDETAVLRLRDVAIAPVIALLTRFGLELHLTADTVSIPGSYWGESEAGLIGSALHARLDTPLQSLLHEACHFICMDSTRREQLHRDAGGDYDEENAVCYLQIVLADCIPGFGRARMFTDMDAWGYTFRLGSARAWFEREAQDASEWLTRQGLLDVAYRPTWKLRA